MTLKQMKGFLGIQILGYGEYAQPLSKCVTETKQAKTHKLVWSPETQKAFKAIQTSLLQAPTLSCPTGSEFSSLLKKGYGHIE